MIKYVSASRDRDKDTRVTFETQGFAYEFIADFPKYPVEDWQFIDVSSGFCDQEDNLYILMRDRASSIVKCDPEGQLSGQDRNWKIHPDPPLRLHDAGRAICW